MKVLKRANQKNVLLNRDAYTCDQVNELLESNTVFYFGNYSDEFYEKVDYYEFRRTEFRVFLNEDDRLEVKLDEYGYYENVLIRKDGTTLHIVL